MLKKSPTLVIMIVVALLAWSPWITQDRAVQLTEDQFNEAWSGTIDGCGTAWHDLGAKDFRKIPFGAMVTLEYQCGLVMQGEPALETQVYVAFFGTAFGYPAP